MTRSESDSLPPPRRERSLRSETSSQRLNLAESVADQLGEAIVAGRFAVGEILPSEARLRDEFSVSRSVLREAIKILEVKGFLAARPKRGTWVQPKAAWDLLDPGVLRWLCNKCSSRAVLVQAFEWRLIVEPAAASLAAMHATQNERCRIRAAIPRFDETDWAISRETAAFHEEILGASGNPFLKRLSQFVRASIAMAFRSGLHNPAVRGMAYTRIADSISDRDPVGAEGSMRALLEKSLLDCAATGDANGL